MSSVVMLGRGGVGGLLILFKCRTPPRYATPCVAGWSHRPPFWVRVPFQKQNEGPDLPLRRIVPSTPVVGGASPPPPPLPFRPQSARRPNGPLDLNHLLTEELLNGIRRNSQH